MAEPGADQNLYELARQQRIAANKARLAELGLVGQDVHSLAPARPPPTKRPRTLDGSQDKPAPLRRSLRGAGKEPELPPELEHLSRNRDNCEAPLRSAPALRPAPIVPKQGPLTQQEGEALRDHNNYRLSYMSDEALERRAYKITNINKLADFVKVLKDAGKTELAEAAEKRLHALIGNAK